MIWILIYLVFCVIIGWVYMDTRLGFLPGFLLSLILSPIIAFVISLFFPPKQKDPKLHPVSNLSKADELQKFAQLRDSGAISADEYEREKARLLK